MADKKTKVRKRKLPAKVHRLIQKKKWLEEEKSMKELEERCQNIDSSSVSKFTDFPISHKTIEGLSSAGYTSPTEIQKEGIAIALRGCDVLGAAKTGSGKTLAFLVPIIELLWRQKWTSVDGLGALVITPTRELAYQIFEVLCKIGQKHDLSAGLIIGGKDLKHEQERILRTNIIICTPGRLLQHMDETPNFECCSLQLLVLDEADRLLDMGFAATLNAIIENLPSERQTLLYSATQTRSVRDLARLSLQDPEYVAVHEKAKTSTPSGLKQSYVVCELPEKLNFLYSFMRNHLKAKILVFMSSCKQVKFVYEAFRRLRPGIPLMALYGKQKQLKRVGIFNDFCKKTQAVLFATDIAARGLDIPSVQWVVQLDCPEDANTYIHRAGRTARYHKDGQSLLILLPSEEQEMLKALEEKKVPITKISANPKKLGSIQKKLESFCAQDQNLKHWAQKSIVSYARSVFLQGNKKIFDVHKLPLNNYALALGLPNAPRIRFMQKAEKKFGREDVGAKDPNKQEELLRLSSELVAEGTSSEEGSSDDETCEKQTGERQGFSFHDDGDINGDDDDNDCDGGLILKKRNVVIEDLSDDEALRHESKRNSRNDKLKMKSKVATVKKLLNKKIKLNTKIVFDDDGEVSKVDSIRNDQSQDKVVSSGAKESQEDEEETGGISLVESARQLYTADKDDRRNERKRIKSKHKHDRLKVRNKNREAQGQAAVTLFQSDSSDDQVSDEDEQSSEEESNFHKSSLEPQRKRKRLRGKENEEEKEPTTGGHLQEDEELALQLLAHSS